MKEMFPCGLFQPLGSKVFGVVDDGIIYGKEKIIFNQIEWIKLMTAPTLVTNGVAQMKSGGKIYQLVYKFSDRERAASAIGYATEQVEKANGVIKNYKYCLTAHTGSTLEVYENYLIIKHMRTGGVGTVTANVFSGGQTGGKRIYYSDITAIQFKEPAGVTVGFIQFAYAGSGEIRGGVVNAINDENAIPVSFQNLSFAKEIVDFIESKRHQQSSSDMIPFSSADELKKYKELLDSGIINQEEFDAKKKQLLNI